MRRKSREEMRKQRYIEIVHALWLVVECVMRWHDEPSRLVCKVLSYPLSCQGVITPFSLTYRFPVFVWHTKGGCLALDQERELLEMIAGDEQNRKQELQVFSSELESVGKKVNSYLKLLPPVSLFGGKGQCICRRKLWKPQWYWFKMRTHGGKDIAGNISLLASFFMLLLLPPQLPYQIARGLEKTLASLFFLRLMSVYQSAGVKPSQSASYIRMLWVSFL